MNRTLEKVDQYYDSLGKEHTPYRIEPGSVDALLRWIAPWHSETEVLLEYARHYLPADPPPELPPIESMNWMNFFPSPGTDMEPVSVSMLPQMHDGSGSDPNYALISSGFLYVVQGSADEEQILLDIRTGKVLIVHNENGFMFNLGDKRPGDAAAISAFREEVYATCPRADLRHPGTGALGVVNNLNEFDELIVRMVKTDDAGKSDPSVTNFIDLFHNPDKYLLSL